MRAINENTSLSDYCLCYIPKIPEKNREKINFRMFLKIMKQILIILRKNQILEKKIEN